MKFLIIVCLALIAVTYAKDAIKLPPKVQANFNSFIGQCLDEHKLTLDAVAGLNMGDFSNTSHELQCFADCILNKFGFFVDGVIKEDVIVEFLTPILGEKLTDIMDKCNGLKGADNCETAFKLYQCYYSQNL